MAVIPIGAEEEYKKNPDIKREDVVALRQWMERQPHLPKIPEVQLILFYHSCEGSMELTKSTIETYYSLRTQFEQYFLTRDPGNDINSTALQRLLATPLPEVTPEGYLVYYCRLLDFEPSHVLFQTCAKVFMMVSDLVEHERGSFPGVVIVVDMDGLVMGHLTRVTLTDIKYSIQYLQEAMPCRQKGMHLINCPSFMDTIMGMMKPFLNKHLIQMLHLHPAPIDSLYDFIPKRIMPKDLGGEAPSYVELRDSVVKKLNDNRQYFADEEKYRCDESKRQGAVKDYGGGFGTDGSFKKLSFD